MHVHFKSSFFSLSPHTPSSASYLPFITWRGSGGGEGGRGGEGLRLNVVSGCAGVRGVCVCVCVWWGREGGVGVGG